MPGETGGWQPHIQRVGQTKYCGHVRYDPETRGYALDCNRGADFIRTAGDGRHEYACGRHVAEMPDDAR